MAISKLHDSMIYNNVNTVYKVQGFSLQEVLNNFFNKINDCIDVSNQALDFLTWLKETGLPEEVKKELEQMYNDGRLSELINDTLLKEINSKVDNFGEEVKYTSEELVKLKDYLNYMPINGGDFDVDGNNPPNNPLIDGGIFG